MKIEILLADDQFLILESIKAILESEQKIEVVGTAQDGKTAIALVKELRPDILLIDIEMPKMNGILATKYICKYLPDTKVIVLTSHKDQDYIAEALLAGASGYLWKGNLIQDLKQEIYSFGKGYPGIKAKLLTQNQKNFATNTVNNRGQIIYLKKYHKNIYKPAVSQKPQRSRKIYNLRVNPDDRNFKLKPLTTKKIRTTNLKIPNSPNVHSLLGFNHRKYIKKIIWLLLAIASIVLSIVIF